METKMKIFLLLPLIIVELFVPIYTNTCEDGWLHYEKSCYYFSDVAANWTTAKVTRFIKKRYIVSVIKGKCAEKGSKVAEINDEGENTFLTQNYGEIFYIGMTDAVNVGTWIGEISGQPITYTNWSPGEPNNVHGLENCAVVDRFGRWVDIPCSHVHKYYCEKSDYCDPNPCSNGGVCSPEDTGYTCTCITGYTGTKCETDSCDPNPCSNGGVCNREDTGYTCTCIYGYTGTKCETAALSVESCTMLAVNYTVISGMANGITYLQGPLDSCTRFLSGSPSESFRISYGECGLNPSLDSTNSIEITIIVQDKADITSGDDDVYTIKCTFRENEDAEVTFETQVTRKNESSYVNVEVFPNPLMRMYRQNVQSDYFEELTDTAVVFLGDYLRQEISLDQISPNYKVRVKTCSMKAKTLEDVILEELPLLNNVTSCSVLGTTYPGFTYLTTDGSPSARVDFNAFTPTLPAVDLLKGVKIEIACTVSVCFGANSVCDEPSCGTGRRKRRENRAVGKNPMIRNYEDLSEGFIIRYEDMTGLSNLKSITRDSSEQSRTSLVESTQFWAILISALVVLVIVSLITFSIVKYLKKERTVTNKGLGDDIMSTKMGDFQFSGRDSWSTSVRGPYYGCDSYSNHLCDPRMTHNGPCRREPPPDYDARPVPHNPIGQRRHNYRN